jgi:oxalate decarboxylase/phosphoglucose isomerase-like protein (cupin superfamily)
MSDATSREICRSTPSIPTAATTCLPSWAAYLSRSLQNAHSAHQHPGDLWYFPPGIPHYLQALNTTANGAEFLLVFPSGTFSEDNTFLLTDWLAHVPKEVIAKNFGTDVSAFDKIPSKELYIFPAGTRPGQ